MVRRLAVLLAVALVAACQAGASGPGVGPSAPLTPSPSADVSDAPSAAVATAAAAGPTATPERIDGTFTSGRHGSSWTLPEGWSVTELEAIEKEVFGEVTDAVRFAKESPWPEVSTLYDYLYSNPIPHSGEA